MADILVFQNNETAATLVNQTNPGGVQLLSYVNTFFCHVVVCCRHVFAVYLTSVSRDSPARTVYMAKS